MGTIKENIFTVDRLEQMILETKAQQKQDWIAIKDEVAEIKHNLKPLNLIRNTVEEINEAVGVKSHLAQSAISIGIGYLAKRLVVGKSDSAFKSIFGSVIQLIITNLVSKPHESESSHEDKDPSQYEPSQE
ncbi:MULTISPECIES: hypothetical protein [Flavobacterium]|jgi:hypothetical protein|uniref:DUF883 family protein n=1 Tax=Flavobacterium pectinovorum TaxID=29533 RepID=A0AB36P159_9FLAO|nr:MULTISPECIES: hypothetical protein [Flavobacterium]KIQ17230.1 hypothetical protein RT99_19020 [Flavobacterium sp. MEB061]OXB04994.1 hypothetical protein B0A72_10985 [Flavobacterium pectinovorum]SHL32071.1 hypothetical protein SAMN05444387_0314 [Flavobacterium pectinovorum]